MCGIAGFLDKHYAASDDASSIACAMADAVAHRGPDDAGMWLDPQAGVALAHRRLAVIDLSPAGRQPMQSASGRNVVAFNGEIYNHRSLRREIEVRFPGSAAWKGCSDTETLLAAVESLGIEEALRAVTGMFAFALWDRRERVLYLARDRAGEKPLYYGWQNGVFMFGSELKALAAHPAFAGDVDRNVLALFLRHGYVPAPWSIYSGLRKLPAGAYVGIAAETLPERIGEWPEPQRYWSLRDAVAAGRARPFGGSAEDAADELHEVLLKAVGLQMTADVPLGAFLSGGVDSSTIVALMQAQSPRPVRTFTIGFDDPAYDEAKHARAVANHLRTEHVDLYVSPRMALEVIPRLPVLFDEPFADSSQIPTFLVAEMARRHVTVALSGDGGDEMFGGYEHYLSTPRIWRWLLKAPAPLRRFCANAVIAAAASGSDNLPTRVLRRLPMGRRGRWTPARARKAARFAQCRSQEELHLLRFSHWLNPDTIVGEAFERETVLNEPRSWPDASEFAEKLMAVDALSYLPDDLLVKMDRAAMGVSLETRAPLLDHRVMEFAWRLPLSFRIRNARGKQVLRQVLYKYVPREIVDRPKAGFCVPIASWLRGPLRDWAEDLLDDRRLKAENFFHPKPVHDKWREHLRGTESWDTHLWIVLMFQAWLDYNRRRRPAGGVKP